jgi:hypothetical protein
MDRECNVCGGTTFADMGARKNVRCASCGSLERTRAMQLVLSADGLVQPGRRVMHLAPDLGLARNIKRIVGDGYEAYDLSPEKFPGLQVKRINLIADVEALPTHHYDLVIHSHVMEHVACNVTAVLFHLHRSLTPEGAHVFCIPLMGGHYDTYFGELPSEIRIQRFGQHDHVRSFGVKDLAITLGMIFSLPPCYDLEERFHTELLDRYNIPPIARKGFTGSTVFVMRKRDLKLRE